jgi:hypothetical protein
MPAVEVPSGIQMPRSAHVLQIIHCQSRGRTQRLTFAAHVMKVLFSNQQKRSELRAVLTVAAVLMIGILAKLGASIQLSHLSH